MAAVDNWVYSDCCRDERIKAVEVLDGFLPSDVELDGHVPLLIAHADTDPLIEYTQAQEPSPRPRRRSGW